MRMPHIGDRVATDDGLRGTLVVDIDAAEAIARFDAAEWAYLRVGVMVETDEIGLVHYIDRAGVRLAERS